MATVSLTPDALKQIATLPKSIKARVLRLTERLQKWPEISGVKPLRGRLTGHYRLRTGDYRVQFRVNDETIVVEKVGHRDKFYKG